MKCKWVILRENGEIEFAVTDEKTIPPRGDGKVVDELPCAVIGTVRTDHLDFVRHIFVKEQ